MYVMSFLFLQGFYKKKVYHKKRCLWVEILPTVTIYKMVISQNHSGPIWGLTGTLH